MLTLFFGLFDLKDLQAQRQRTCRGRAYMEQQAEKDLIERCRGGDRKAFANLVDHYKVLVFNLVDRMIFDKALVEDLAQEVFIRVYQGLPGFRGEAKLSTWIYRVAYNVCAAELERARHRVDVVSLDAKWSISEISIGLDTQQLVH